MKSIATVIILLAALTAFGQQDLESVFDDSTAFEEMTFEESPDTMFTDITYSDTAAFDDFFYPDTSTITEETMEYKADPETEALLADNYTESEIGKALIGYTLGLDASYPIYRYGGLGRTYNSSQLAFGLVLNSPFGLTIGPLDFGFGIQLGNFGFRNTTWGGELSGRYILASAHTTFYQTPQAIVSAELGTGYFGKSLGITSGIAFDYALPGTHLVIKPYVRANATLDSGVEVRREGDTPSYLWFNMGFMLSYDISTIKYEAIFENAKNAWPF